MTAVLKKLGKILEKYLQQKFAFITNADYKLEALPKVLHDHFSIILPKFMVVTCTVFGL